MTSRHFLFLQGLRSPFFMRLALALRAHGQSISKINYTVGDALYWQGAATACRVPLEKLAEFYQLYFKQEKPTDIVLFGDCRPVHMPAIQLASSAGIRVHVFEEGYFRPAWVTLESQGVNGNSLLPKQSAWYRKAAMRVKEEDPPIILPSALKARVLHDIAYNLASIANRFAYPDYPSHITYDIHSEYLAYVRRVVRVRRTRSQDNAMVQKLAQAKDFFLIALQVRGDAQLRFHSDYADSEKLLREVLSSFAAHAPPETRLVVKNHPLDPGFTHYGAYIARLAKPLNISDRVVFLETGHLPTLLDHARGLVTVNSTTIGQALYHCCPVKALGRGIFNIDALTYQGSLDTFWSTPGAVDTELFEDFQKVVMHLTQINGGLYSAQGIALAVRHAVPRLLETRSRLDILNEAISLR